MIPAGTDRSITITAVVHAPDGVRFVAAARSVDRVVSALVEYVRRRCDDVLWPSAAPRVHALIEARRPYAAIAAYFEHVGSRWDEEGLVIHVTARRAAALDGIPDRTSPAHGAEVGW